MSYRKPAIVRTDSSVLRTPCSQCRWVNSYSDRYGYMCFFPTGETEYSDVTGILTKIKSNMPCEKRRKSFVGPCPNWQRRGWLIRLLWPNLKGFLPLKE